MNDGTIIMQRVLIIALDYPPKASSASRRPFGLSKYLPEYGWEPVVLTISERGRNEDDHPGTKVIESDLLSKPRFIANLLDVIHKRHKETEVNDGYDSSSGTYYRPCDEKRWITKLRSCLLYPDRYFISWYRKAVKGYLQFATEFPVDAIISTAKPFTAHLIARRIKSRTQVPWVADFRDLWPHWEFYENDTDYRSIKYLLDRILTRWVLSSADALVTVSPPLKSMLRKRFRAKRVYSIPNGFDPQDYTDGIKPDPSMFLITYTGHVRTDCQDPEILLRATSELVKTKNIDRRLIKVRFYGEITNELLRDIDKHAIKDVVQADGIRRPRNDILPKQMESSLLIIFAALDPANTGTATGKIYEYLAAKRPILAIGKPDGADVVEDILSSTCAGVYARTLEEIKETIMLYYNQFTQKGEVGYHGISSEIDKFSYKEMAMRYARVLDKIVKV